ncbi:MAG: hypothetical protein ACLF0P_16205 [Thermoanaerobaculia bacterium]
MRNETESSRASSNLNHGPNTGADGREGRDGRGREALASAFRPAFLTFFQRRASRLEGLPASAPSALAPAGSSGSSGAAFWAGPWEVERADAPHGPLWAVVRRGEPVADGGRPVAMTRHRADAVVLAAALPALAVPNRLRLAEKAKRLGFPLHDGAACVGHLARPEPRVVELVHAVRSLLTHPECLALAVECLDAEELPILGRALMRRVQAGAE